MTLVAQMVKHLLQWGRPGFDPWVGKIPWRRKWQPSTVLLPGKSHGERSLVGYSPWGRKESDTTERLHHVTLPTTPNPPVDIMKASIFGALIVLTSRIQPPSLEWQFPNLNLDTEFVANTDEAVRAQTLNSWVSILV